MFRRALNITYSSRSQSLEISHGSKYQHKLFPVRYVNLFVIHFAIQSFSKFVLRTFQIAQIIIAIKHLSMEDGGVDRTVMDCRQNQLGQMADFMYTVV